MCGGEDDIKYGSIPGSRTLISWNFNLYGEGKGFPLFIIFYAICWNAERLNYKLYELMARVELCSGTFLL